MMTKNYAIGLDIGTGSVGYAVTDMMGNLFKFKKKNMWGVRLFETGNTAAARRSFRGTRRRYERRRQRLTWLREIFSEEISNVDSNFFIRMKESFLWKEDRSIDNLHILFDDKDFTDKDYYRSYKNIYELRHKLCISNEKADLRLIYLALHHIVKYRGNFLYEGQEFNASGNINNDISGLLEAIDALYETEMNTTDNQRILLKILSSNTMNKREKEELINQQSIVASEIKDIFKQIIKGILGYQTDFSKIFNLEGKHKESFAKKDISELDLELGGDLSLDLLEKMFALYSSHTLNDILMGKSSISEGMIARYEKHRHDLKVLKELIKKEFTHSYNELFIDKTIKGRRGLVKVSKPNISYASYCKRCIKDSEANANLCVKIKKILEIKKEILAGNDQNYDYCIKEIEQGNFLKLLNIKENGAIPYQLHEQEMRGIIEKQQQYYPFLRENAKKMLSLITFRIPYYVGPLNGVPDKKRSFDWAVRKSDGKVYPWNFEEVIDKEASAEKFIAGLTNKCTYLPNEDVLPKYSLLYSEYEVLSELNKIKVNGSFIKDSEFKRKMLVELFANPKRAKVSEKDLIKYLKDNKCVVADKYDITGFQKDKEFASYQKARADFTKILGSFDDKDYIMIEKIIKWVTVFEDKELLFKKVTTEYGNKLSKEQIKAIVKLRYKGWGRLSEKLLNRIHSTDCHQDKYTIIELMRKTNFNLMQIINDDEYQFKKEIEQALKDNAANKNDMEYINELPTSPAVKKAVRQTLLVLDELVKVNKQEPNKIFIEFARDVGAPKRTKSRFLKLLEIFNNWSNNNDNEDILKELKANEKHLDKTALYLYFTQNGKCMYSGDELNIYDLDKYQVDHIIPQSYIKDDSLDNRVLVKTVENQYKGDNLLLKPQIINKQRVLWNSLLQRGLISQKKFAMLTKHALDAIEIKKFINRQLVETRQITKYVAQLISNIYPNTKVETVRASFSSDLREQYGLYKVREINDYHHAFDAYLAVLEGIFISKRYPNWEESINYNDYKKYASNKEFAKKQKNGYFVGKFAEQWCDRDTGEIIWNGPEIIQLLHKVYEYKDCFISKKVEEGTGEFYGQIIITDLKKSKQPLKKGLAVEKYGGYTGTNNAYSVVIEKNSSNKIIRELVAIPINVSKLEENNKNAVSTYIIKYYGEGSKIASKKILKFQNILYEGQEYYFISGSKAGRKGTNEVQNAKQLVLSSRAQKLLYTLKKIKRHNDLENGFIDKNVESIYELLVEKIKNEYFGYKSVLKKLLEKKGKFLELKPEQQIKILFQILEITQANANTGDLKTIGLSATTGRKGTISLDVEKLIFINKSVTGLFEKRCKL